MEMTTNMMKEFDRLAKKYKKELDVFEKKALIGQVKGKITEHDLYSVAKKLENTENWLRFTEEANGGLGDLGPLQKVALGVVLAQSIADVTPLFAGVQPLDSEVGIIYYKKIESLTNKKTNTKGQTLLDKTGRKAFAIMSEGESTEVVGVGDGDNKAFTYTAEYAPVLRRYVEVKLENHPEIRGIDDGNGTILGNGVSGSINYETGAIALTFNEAPEKDEKIFVTYQTSYGAESMTELPTISNEFEGVEVRAKTYALRGITSLLKMYGMQKKFGIDAAQLLAQDLTNELQAVIGMRTIENAYVSIPANNVVEFDVTPPSGVSAVEHRLAFMTSVFPQLQGKILDASGRFVGQGAIIAGGSATAYLMGMPGFTPAGYQFNTTGVIFVGSLNGTPIIRANMLPDNELIYIAKGPSPFESAIIQAPYLPIFQTELYNSVDHNPLKAQKAIAASLGIKTVLPGMMAKLKFKNL